MMPRGILPNFVVDTTLWTLLYSLNKGCCKKKTYFLNFVFEISMLKRSRILKILVCTPHNYGDIVVGRDKIFLDPRSFEHRNCENKILKRIFFCNTLYCEGTFGRLNQTINHGNKNKPHHRNN